MATPPAKAKKQDRKTERKVINSEGRQIVARVYHFMKDEAENGVHRATNARWRTARATGVSERTVTQILKEEKNLPSTSGKFVNPMSKRKKRLGKTDVDSFSAEIVRMSIEEYKEEHKKLPTLTKLKQILYVRISFNGSLNTLRRMLLKLGLEWRKLSGAPVKRRPKGSVPPNEKKLKNKKRKNPAESEIPQLEKINELQQPTPPTPVMDQRLYPTPFAPQFFNNHSHTSYDTSYPMARPQDAAYPMLRLEPLYPTPHDPHEERSKLDTEYQEHRAHVNDPTITTSRTIEQCDISTLLKQ